MDESNDIKDSEQLLVHRCSLTPTFELCEDLLSMETLSSCTRGEDMIVAAKNACIRNGKELKNLHGICTNGAPGISGNRKDFVARFSEYASKEYDNKQLTNLHCIIHQEALCVKSIALNKTFCITPQFVGCLREKHLTMFSTCTKKQQITIPQKTKIAHYKIPASLHLWHFWWISCPT